MIKFAFKAKKSAQAASLLLARNGGDMQKYCFIKMLYLADRKAFARWGEPITGDHAVSMQHGPVLSAIYNLTKGELPHLRANWEPFISDADPETHQVSLKENPGTDKLSRAEIKILEDIYAEFKDFTWKQMKDYCHEFEEYDQTVGKGSRPIATEKIMEAVGKSDEEIRQKQQDLNELKLMEALFATR
ncbi:MAG TPA: Panacea domain-containing protein [Chthoniobacteraceae bacterium]|nr:Panacea domain-containing protein [Chthoniobacteraceae bacterium]